MFYVYVDKYGNPSIEESKDDHRILLGAFCIAKEADAFCNKLKRKLTCEEE